MIYAIAAIWIALAVFFLAGVLATLLKTGPAAKSGAPLPPLSILLPVRGHSAFLAEHVRLLAAARPPGSELLVAVAQRHDPAYAIVDAAVPHPRADVHLLVGEDPALRNPKLRNIAKAYARAKHDLIFFIDDSVAADAELFRSVVSELRPGIGIASAAPLATAPRGLAAEIECATCNGYQFRMQMLLALVGRPGGFGNAMALRKRELEAAGGLVELDRGPCEDNAAIVLMRRRGYGIRLARTGTARRVGYRSFREIWLKHLRWRNCPKCHDLLAFAVEPWLGGLAFIALGSAALGGLFGLTWWSSALIVAGLWYGGEAILHLKPGWHFGRLTVAAWLIRDLMHPILTIVACFTPRVDWRGISVEMRRIRRDSA